MSRSSKAFLAVVTVSLLGFATPTVFGLDMPNPKPKKDKKKKDDAASSDNKPADSSTKSDAAAPAKSDSTATAPAAKDEPAKDDAAAKTADAPPPAAAPAAPPQTIEMKFPKSLWETSGAKDMKVGDWIEGEMPMVPGSKSRQEVLEVGDHYTVVAAKSTMMGTTSEQKMKTIYSEPDADPKDVEKQRKDLKIETKEFADKLTIGGKEVACTRYETFQEGKLVSKAWVSKEVPLGGAVKAEMADGKVATIITGFGRGK